MRFSPLEITTYLSSPRFTKQALIRREILAARSVKSEERATSVHFPPTKRYRYISFEMRLCKRSSRSRNESLGRLSLLLCKATLFIAIYIVATTSASSCAYAQVASKEAPDALATLKRSSMIPMAVGIFPLSTRQIELEISGLF